MTQRQIVYQRAEEFCTNNKLEELGVIVGKYAGGNKCHEIAFHEAFVNDIKIVVALCFIPNSGVNVHFINDDIYDFCRDNTLGYLSQYNDYFKLAEFGFYELEDYDHPQGASNLLMEFKLNMLNALFTEKEQEELEITTEHI